MTVLPIMDGSAGPFVFLIQSAGVEDQNARKKFIRIKKSVTVTEGDTLRIKRLVDALNEERLVAGQSIASPEEYASAVLTRAVLVEYRDLFGSNALTAAGGDQ